MNTREVFRNEWEKKQEVVRVSECEGEKESDGETEMEVEEKYSEIRDRKRMNGRSGMQCIKCNI